MTLLQSLQSRTETQQRIALIVAHPDDETIAAGASLHLMPNLLLIHVTDGAPRRQDDATRQGFPTPEAYAAAREAELHAALRLIPTSPTRIKLGIPDQDAYLHLPEIAETLNTQCKRHEIEVILTHAYEGGHPDHDSTAIAVQTVLNGCGAAVVEFAGYHAGPEGGTTFQRFLPGPPETTITLNPEDAARKQAMLACFRTQRDILGAIDPSTERFRPAPRYDFTHPPHPGPLNYENWGWDLTGAKWRTRAASLPCAA